MYIIISLLSIVIGLIGVVKNKRPEYEDGPGLATNTNYYLLFYGMLIFGVVSLIIEIKSLF